MDKIVPIGAADLKFNSDGELKVAGDGGGGGTSTSDTAVVTKITPADNTSVLLVAANENRKSFVITCVTSSTYLLFGGVDGEGNVIPDGQPGAVNTNNYTMQIGAGNGIMVYESGPVCYTGAITIFHFGTGHNGVRITELE